MGNILNRWIHTLNCCILDIVHILEQCITLYDGGGGRGYFQCKINVTNLPQAICNRVPTVNLEAENTVVDFNLC